MRKIRTWTQPLRIALVLASLFIAAPAGASGSTGATPPDELNLASVNAAVARLEDGEILFSKRAGHVVPIASITKLMAAMVVLDGGQPLDEWLTIRARKAPPPNNAYSRIRIGSKLPRGELLRIALMASENLAIYNLASHYPGGLDAFIDGMNAKAAALGMANSRFVGPSGLSPGNRSTAADVLKMVSAAYEYERIREYTTTSYHAAHFRSPRYRLPYGNTNPLVSRDAWGVAVSKTGYLDEAGRCLTMVVNVDGERIAVALLDSFGSRTPVGDAGRVRRWLETGEVGTIAGAALRYERRRAAALESSTASR